MHLLYRIVIRSFHNNRDFDQKHRMTDQIIDAMMARSIHADTADKNVLAGWIILRDPPEHPGKFVARLATTHPTIYVMMAETLAELQAMLPPGLERSPRQPADPPEVVEVWFLKQGECQCISH